MLPQSEKTGSFRWTEPRARAALLVAEDELSHAEIADRVGVAKSTLSTWKNRPEFAAHVGGHVDQLQAGMLRYRVAKKRKRLAVLDDLHTKLLTVVAERGEELDGVAAGGATGIIVRQVKQIGSGRDAQIVEEFAVDAGLVREIRAVHEQAAKELGQWVDKGELDISGGLRREYVIVRETSAAPDIPLHLDPALVGE